MALTFGFPWRGRLAGHNDQDRGRTRKARDRRHRLVPRPEALEGRRLLSLISDPGGQTVYDTVTHTHWLADANAAADPANQFGVQGINLDGSMTWETAMNWVAALNQNDYLGHKDWILPRTPRKDTKDATLYNKSQGFSYGFDFYTSDMGELFYKELGGTAGTTISSLHNANTKLFNNFQPEYYWGGPTKRKLPADFSFGNGFLGTDEYIDFEYALPEYPSTRGKLPHTPKNNVVTLRQPAVTPSLVPSSEGLTVYDADLNITWLADADLAATEHFGVKKGINPDGSMTYGTAVAWVAAMNAADYLGHNDWRLPSSTEASPKQGYYQTGTEMGELYYTELGGQAGSTIQLTHDSDAGLFNNFQPYYYWSNTNVGQKVHSHQTFSFGSGYRSDNVDPNEMYVIPVFDGPPSGPSQPTVLTVTNNHDIGSGSLRAVVAAATDGDIIEFSPTLAGRPITLNSQIDISNAITIEGLGADSLTISGGGANRIFDVHQDAGAVTLSGLTLAMGQADEGGAILDDGASLALTSDTFQNDQATATALGKTVSGGALAVLGESTTGMSVTITDCRFSGDSATGVAGGQKPSGAEFAGSLAEGGALFVDAGTSASLSLSVTGTTFSGDTAAGGSGHDGLADSVTNPTDGGYGEGGAVFLAADEASQPAFAFASDTFSQDSAIGGQGGKGGSAVDGQDGADGGHGDGGAVFYTADYSAAPSLSIATSTLASNSAVAGEGGAGGSSTEAAHASGAGGSGGTCTGGAVFASFYGSAAGTITLRGDTVASNAVQGGDGADGGPVGSQQVGGNGGDGGSVWGGGIAVTYDDNAAATSLTIEQSEIRSNTAQAGDGGKGRGTTQSKEGGDGGNGGDVSGIGLYLNGSGSNGADTWTLQGDVIDDNASGSPAASGGAGGDGHVQAGNGGDGGSTSGGGVYDIFAGTLDIFQCTISLNATAHGFGGDPGTGPHNPQPGSDGSDSGGGVYVDPTAKAFKSPDTVIAGNSASSHKDVDGTIVKT